MTTRKTDKKDKSGFAFWGTLVSIILAVASLVLVVLEQYGVTLPGIMPSVMACSGIWFPILCGITGGFIGWNIRNNQAKKELESIEKRLGMTPEEAVAKLRAAETDARTNKQAADNEQPILRGEEALDFIASLPENQRQLLQDIYDAGGSFEADPFDAELSSMAHYGLVLRPAAFYPGEPATWILPPNINRIIHDYPMILDGQDAVESNRQLNEDMREIETLSQGQAAVVWIVYAHGGSIVLSSLGYRSVEVRARSDVFVVTKTEDDAVSYVHLTPEWNRLMHDRWDEFLDHFKLERPPVFE